MSSTRGKRKRASINYDQARHGSDEDTEHIAPAAPIKKRKGTKQPEKEDASMKSGSGGEDEEAVDEKIGADEDDDDAQEESDDLDDPDEVAANPLKFGSKKKDGASLLENKSDAAIYNDRNLSFVEKVEKALEALNNQKHRMPQTKSQDTGAPMADMFSHPPKDGKQVWKPLTKGKAPPTLVTTINRKLGKVTAELSGPDNSKIKFDLFNQGNLDFTGTPRHCTEAMDLIAKFANAWPDAPLDVANFKRQVIATAVAVMSPPQVRIKVPQWTQSGFRIKIPYFNTDSNAMKEFSRETYAGVSLEATIPDIPSSAELWYKPKGQGKKETVLGKDPNGLYPSCLPTDRDVLKDPCFKQGKQKTTTTLDELRTREKFERFLSWKLAGRMATKKQMDAAVKEYETLYFSGKRHGYKVNRAYGLVKVWYHTWKKIMYFDARKTLTRELKGVKLPKLFIRSPNFAWTKPVIEATRRKWRETGNAAETWLEAAGLVDIANNELKAGNPPLEGCYCTPEMRNDVTHMCEKCGSEVPCVTRTRNVWGLYLCKSCFSRQSESLSLIEDVIKVGLQRQFRGEAASVGRSWEDSQVQKVYQEAFQFLKNQVKDCEPNEWLDQYTGLKRTIPPTFHPFFPSVEAIDPFTCRPAPGKTLQTWVHAAPNLGMIPHAMNIAKGNSLLASVAEIGANCKASVRPEDKQQLDETLVSRVAEHRLISLRYGLAKKQRVNASFTQEEYNAAQVEFRTGRFNTGGSLDRQELIRQSARVYFHRKVCAWNDEQKNDISSICDEIQEVFGVDVSRSELDEAPWPFKYEPMPDTWDWTDLYSLVYERHDRMKFACNKYWHTIDTKMSLACEIFYQSYAESREFLGLPLSGNLRNPLRMSVAHKVHGKQMRTGWPAAPKSLADRNSDENNILMETWFSNCLKFDFDESHHDNLRGLVKAIAIPSDLYDRNAPMTTVVPAVVQLPSKDADLDELFDMSEVFDVANAETEELLAKVNGEDEADDEVEDAGDVEDKSAISIKALKGRCRAVRERIAAFGLEKHNTVIELNERLLSWLLLDDPDDSALMQLAGSAGELEEYVEKMTAGMGDVAEQEENTTNPRFVHFRQSALEALTTSVLDTPTSLQLFMDMINSNIPAGFAEFTEDESTSYMATMQGFGEVIWDADTDDVRRAGTSPRA